MPADLPTGLSESPGILSAAAASHASNAQNEYLNSNDEEEAVVDFVNTNLEFDDVNEDNNNVTAGREGNGDELRINDADVKGEEEEEVWKRVSKKRKKEMTSDELCTYFDSHLKGVGNCPNQGCDCVAILADKNVRECVVKYLCWFEGRSAYDQHSIMFEWYKYSSYLKKAKTKYIIFRLQFIDDSKVDIPKAVKTHARCTRGLLLVLGWGLKKRGADSLHWIESL